MNCQRTILTVSAVLMLALMTAFPAWADTALAPGGLNVIKTAVEAASTGGTFTLSAGVYTEDPFFIPSGVNIYGADRRTVTIQESASTLYQGGTAFIWVKGSNVNLAGFTAQGRGVTGMKLPAGTTLPNDNSAKYGINMAGSLDKPVVNNTSVTLTNITSRYFNGTGVNINGANGMTLNKVESAYNNGAGIYLSDAHLITINNVSTIGNSWGGVCVNVYGATFAAGTSGIVFTGANSFKDVGFGGSPLWLESDKVGHGQATEVITYSNKLADGAMVTYQDSDFGYTAGPIYTGGTNPTTRYFFPSVAEATSYLAGYNAAVAPYGLGPYSFTALAAGTNLATSIFSELPQATLDTLKGAKGADGASVTSASVNQTSGDLTLILDNAHVINAGNAKGPAGTAGAAGPNQVTTATASAFAAGSVLGSNGTNVQVAQPGVDYVVPSALNTKAPLASPAFTGGLTVGTSSTDAPIVISSAINPNNGTGTILLQGDTNRERIEVRSAVGGGAFPPSFQGKASGGSIASPTATPTDSYLLLASASGHDGTGWVSANKGIFGFLSEGAWTPSSQGTYLVIGTTAAGSTTRTEKMRVTGSGNVGIGNPAPTEKLAVSGGNIKITDPTFGLIFPDGSKQTTAAGTVTVTSVAGKIGAVTLVKDDIGLGNVDNTADTAKPISAAAQTALTLKAPLASPAFTGTVTGITKTMVGLGNVDNTSDATKPVSAAQQAALSAQQATIDLKAPLASPAFTGTVTGITKTMIGLANVDNTSDVNKPVSAAQQAALAAQQAQITAQQTAIDQKAPIASPAFTGTVTGITKSMVGLSNVDNTSDVNKPVSAAQQAALAAQQTALAAQQATLASQQAAIDLKAPLASPTFTGTVSGVTSTMVGLGNVADLKVNLSAGAVPTADADSTAGYAVGSRWVTTSGSEFVCTDATATAAVWKETTASVSGLLVAASNLSDLADVASARANLGLSNVSNIADAAKPVSLATQTALDQKAPLASPSFTGTVSGVTKAMVGLANVDNTADVDKPVSAATLAALAGTATIAQGAKADSALQPAAIGTTVQPYNAGTITSITDSIVSLSSTTAASATAVKAAAELAASKLSSNGNGSSLTGITATQVGLGNVNNTADLAKPVSTATQTALDAKAPLVSPVFSGGLTVGSSSTEAPVVISSSINPNYGTGTILLQGDSNRERIEVRSAVGGGAFPPSFQGKAAGGSIASPTATPADTYLLLASASGHDGNGWVTLNKGIFGFLSEGAWTSASQGTYLVIGTTPSGGTIRTEKMRVTGAGNVGIGTSAPTQKLEVAGGIKVGSSGTKPVCDDSARGTFWFTNGAVADDTMEVCAKVGGVNTWKKLW